MAMALAQPMGEQNKGQTLNIEQLWQEFMSDPSQWWDNRADKKNARSPDFRHKRTKEVLWIEGWSNPPWVKAAVAAMRQGRAHFGDGSNVEVHHGAPGLEYNRLAGLNLSLLFTEHQTGTKGSTIGFERGPRKGINKDSSGTCGNVRALCKAGRLKDALRILNQPGIRADSNTYMCLLQECMNKNNLAEGKKVHAHIILSGFKPKIYVLNNLVKFYAKCGSMVDARQVFDKMPDRDVFTWTMMMAAYAKHGRAEEAFKTYEQMYVKGVRPDGVTFTCILNACASLRALEKGKRVHADISKSGIPLDTILENSLVDMYAKCGSMKDACEVFEKMASRNIVSWSAMIAGYAQRGYGREAFAVYEEMQKEGLMPDRIMFTCVLNACASVGSLEKGKEVHADIVKAGIAPDLILENALVDMYGKCRSVKDARQVFDNMARRDVVSWSAMIEGYAQHGCGREALELFQQMQGQGLKPNAITFISLLSACSHVGLVYEGRHYFDSMNCDYGLTPTVEHFGCMVDLLGRAGRLKEAEDFINKMPIKPGAVVWRALLGACRTHSNVEVAERAAKNIIICDPQHAAAYVLLANIYASAGRWDDASKVRKMMEDRGVRKEPGCSCIEVDNQVHRFLVEDKLHPQIEEIHAD